MLFGGLPFFHIFGQTCALNASVMSGAMLTILPKFDPVTALEVMQRDRVTIFAGRADHVHRAAAHPSCRR